MQYELFPIRPPVNKSEEFLFSFDKEKIIQKWPFKMDKGNAESVELYSST